MTTPTQSLAAQLQSLIREGQTLHILAAVAAKEQRILEEIDRAVLIEPIRAAWIPEEIKRKHREAPND